MNPEQPMPTNQKSNSWLKIIIVIIILAILGVAGVFVYNKYFNKNNQNSEFTQEDKDFCKKEAADATKVAKTQNIKAENYEQICLDALLEAKHKATEAKIRGAVSSLGDDANQYFKQNNSYVGWKGNDVINQNIKSLGSQVVYQNTTEDSVMFYAKLPYTGKFSCFETSPTKGGSSLVSQITADMKTCPPNEPYTN